MIIREDNVFTTNTCGGLTYDDCILGQAGTYIKEFVHGDLGRTHPSIGSILGCRAEILQLDVTDVKMDCF